MFFYILQTLSQKIDFFLFITSYEGKSIQQVSPQPKFINFTTSPFLWKICFLGEGFDSSYPISYCES